MHISGAVAIVTGGARGFGKAFTEALLKRGAKVCFADLDAREGQNAERELHDRYGADASFFMKCDVTDQEGFKSVFAATKSKFKKINLVVNNAGILDESDFEKTIAINLTAMMRGTYLAMDYMRRDLGGEGGLVVNVASQAALFPVFFCPAYAASKFGILSFTRSWAMNPVAKKYGISFATLCPAFTDTRMYRDTVMSGSRVATYDENRELIENNINQLGIQGIDDVTKAFVDLVEKEDNNGAVLSVNKLQGAKYRYSKSPHKL